MDDSSRRETARQILHYAKILNNLDDGDVPSDLREWARQDCIDQLVQAAVGYQVQNLRGWLAIRAIDNARAHGNKFIQRLKAE